MIVAKDFIDEVDSRFWKHITTQGPYKDVKKYKDLDRKSFLKGVANSLNKYTYDFGLPIIEYVPKIEGILRSVKCYPLSDTCIYYYVTKKLQEEIDNKIKENEYVYDGFRMTPELRVDEEDFDDSPTNPSYENEFSKTQFRKEWSEYQNLAKSMYDSSFVTYLHFDIAHFYDDINLNLLESTLQDISSGKSDLVNLLFFFLKNSDRLDVGYHESTVGLPQESVGEMSRLLANLYLSRFDGQFNTSLNNLFDRVKYKYFRYADDMWVAFNGPRAKYKEVMQIASLLLQRNKLHINESKTEVLSREKFATHWQFDLWNKVLAIKDNPKACVHLIFQIQNQYKTGRWFSPLLYILKIFTSDRANIQYIPNMKFAMKFLGRLLGEPKFGLRINGGNVDFFTALFEKFPKLDEDVVRPIVDKQFVLYPNVQIFCLELLTMCSARDNLEIIFNRYLSYFGKKYHWYLRCLCLRYMANHGNRIAAWERRKILLSTLSNTEATQNDIERRDSINLLMSFNKDRGGETLNKYFNTTNDLKFREYIINE